MSTTAPFASGTPSVSTSDIQRLQGQVYTKKIFTSNPVLMTYYAGAPPWNDIRLPGAIQQVTSSLAGRAKDAARHRSRHRPNAPR